MLDTIRIAPDPGNTRKYADPDKLRELAASIKQHGVIQPITVRPEADGYVVVCGHRRYHATQIAGLTQIPAIIRNLTPDEVLEVQVLENLQREDISPIDEAHAFESLLKKESIDWLASRIGKSKRYVHDRLRLATLVPSAQQLVNDGVLPIGHATLLSKLTPEQQKSMLNLITFGHDFENDEDPEFDSDDIELEDSYEDLKRRIRDNFMYLTRAEFDTEDPDLYVIAGACTVCPKRTKNQNLLFSDITEDDVCTDGDCFSMKDKLHTEQKIAEAKKKFGPNTHTASIVRWASDRVQVKGIGSHVEYFHTPSKTTIPVIIAESYGTAKVGDVVYVQKPEEKSKAKNADGGQKDGEEETPEREYRNFNEDLEDVASRYVNFIKPRTRIIGEDAIKEVIRISLKRLNPDQMVIACNAFGIETGISVGEVSKWENTTNYQDRTKLHSELVQKACEQLSLQELALLSMMEPVLDDLEAWNGYDPEEEYSDLVYECKNLHSALLTIGFITEGEYKPLSEL